MKEINYIVAWIRTGSIYGLLSVAGLLLLSFNLYYFPNPPVQYWRWYCEKEL